MHTKSFPSLAIAFALCAAPLAPAQQQTARPAGSRTVTVRTQSSGDDTTPNIVINGEAIRMPPLPPMPPMPPVPPLDPHTFSFVSSEMSFDTRNVKGAPYTAEAVTEITQTLADGNRIVRRTASQVARDSEGRTRREATVNLIGNVTSSNDPKPSAVFINDPVAKVNYVLNERDRTARKLPNFSFGFDSSRFENGKFQAELRKRVEAANVARSDKADNVRSLGRDISITSNNGARRVVVTETRNGVTTAKVLEGKEAADYIGTLDEKSKLDYEKFAANGAKLSEQAQRFATNLAEGHVLRGGVFMSPTISKNTTTENLGKQIVEGVEAEGTRTTTTIEAGEIGNERPIVITSERWYSPELQTVVMTRRSDPRHGETTYKLTNINRSEPARSLFEVPADYTIKETPAGVRRGFRVETPKTDGR